MKTLTKLSTKKLTALKGKNQLVDAVIDSIIDYSNDQEERVHYIHNVLQSGCISGTVSDLIYYQDTTAFYNKHKEDIYELADNQANEMGYKSALELFASLNGAEGCGSVDQMENLIAWYGYEETLRNISNELGLDN